MQDNTHSRAALLPYPCDPFLLHYWLGLFEKYWQGEVDKLYIHANSTAEPAVFDYIREMCARNPKIVLITADHQIEHGAVINELLDIVEEEYIMLIEDDGFIFRHGIVDKCFSMLESGQVDIVGSKRGSCGMEILKRAKELWDLEYEGEGDQGCNFWPNFFFTRKQILLDTDRNFGARMWKAGEHIEALNYTVETDQAGDTFVNTSLQLRAKGYKIATVPQYHAHPLDIEHYTNGKYLFDGNAPWTHIGSLSSGVGGVLRDDQDRALIRRTVEAPKGETILPIEWCKTDMEKGEWERRVQWWLTFYQKREIGKIEEFAELYIAAVERIITQYGLKRKNIYKRQRIFATLGL